MRLAWLLSLGLHASLIGVFVLHPFGGGTTPPRTGTARIGGSSEESIAFESRPRAELSETVSPDPAALPVTPLALPLLALRAPLAETGSISTHRVPPQRRPPAVLSSTTVAPAIPSSRSKGALAPPSPLRNSAPRYPAEARRRGWQGTVLLLARVAADGSCFDARVLASSGHRCLDEAALDAVRRWAFSPAMRDGVAVEAEVEVPVNFVLR